LAATDGFHGARLPRRAGGASIVVVVVVVVVAGLAVGDRHEAVSPGGS
jgi:hypothetical protein